jgi:hypothetical protein
MTTPTTPPVDLQAIEARWNDVQAGRYGIDQLVNTDIPALISLIREKENEKKRTADVLSLEGFADAATAIIEYQYVKTQLDDLKAGQEALLAYAAHMWRKDTNSLAIKSIIEQFNAGEKS